MQTTATLRLVEGVSHEQLISKQESSFKGHRVDALVLTGDEGRDKLR